MVRQRVLVVEDEETLQRFYALFFGATYGDEFIWFLAPDGERALSLLDRELLNLVVLDWTIPGPSGMMILKALRAHPRTRDLGVLMVTARTAPADVASALEAGADDYLAKPFDERVLLARLHSLVRRRQMTVAEHGRREFPGLSWDPLASRLEIDGRPVHLAPKEADLLRIFIGRPDMIHAHSFLWDTIWGYEAGDREHILVNAISSLRRKLGAKWGPRLESSKRRGFVFRSP
jgi:two-component system phosphate regulon response regulator PhoB